MFSESIILQEIQHFKIEYVPGFVVIYSSSGFVLLKSYFLSFQKGNTALHIASLAGQAEVVKVLVTNRANVNAQSQVKKYFSIRYYEKLCCHENSSPLINCNIIQYSSRSHCVKADSWKEGWIVTNVNMILLTLKKKNQNNTTFFFGCSHT